MRILFTGGGSGGSAAPVIAVAQAALHRWPSAEVLFVGTHDGPERLLAQAAGLPYAAVRSGRLRRYVTWRNLVDPWLAVGGVGEALRVVARFNPDVAFGAGGFATVPPLVAARFRRVPIVVHQQDVLPGLANRMLAPFASRVTVALSESAALFRRITPLVVGNPVRQSVAQGDAARARAAFNLDPNLPLLFVTGGGTGALHLNHIVAAAAPELVERCEIVHLTGSGKRVPAIDHPRYRQIEFVTDEMTDLLSAANVVITRAGMSALSEIAALAKAAIVVPMPHSHQEANAAVFRRQGAASVVAEEALSSERLVVLVVDLLQNPEKRSAIGNAAARLLAPGAAERLVSVLEKAAREPA